MEPITSPNDPRLDDYRHLTDAAARRATTGEPDGSHGIFIVEGIIALEQLFASRHPPRSLLVTPNRVRALAARVDLGAVPVFVAERDVLEAITGYDVHRGVLASALRPPLPELAEVLDAHVRAVLVQGVTDNENIGAVFRVCAALDLGAVVLDRRCADPLYRRSIRVSSGWTLRVPYTRVDSTETVIAELHARGRRVVALTPASDAVDLDAAAARGHLDDPVAFVIGAEGAGLETLTLEASDGRVRIPMHNDVDSLNVATSLAVVGAFSAARRNWS